MSTTTPVRTSSRIRTKKRPTEDCDVTVVTPSALPPPPLKKRRVQTSTERVKACIERMKERDPEKYQQYKQDNIERVQAYRKNLSEEQKVSQREKNRIRNIEYRQRKQDSNCQTRKTRLSEDDQRKKWREQKQKQKEKRTAQKQSRINQKRRQAYQAKTAATTAANKAKHSVCASTQFESGISAGVELPPTSSVSQPDSLLSQGKRRSANARRKALSRAKAALPNSPRKYVQTVIDLISKASPHPKKMFGASAVTPEHRVGCNVLLQLKQIKKSRSAQTVAARRILLSACSGLKKSKRQQSTLLGVHTKTVGQVNDCRFSTTQMKCEKAKTLEEDIKSFYASSAATLPDQKQVSKKTGMASAVLSKPLSDLYKEYRQNQEAAGLKPFSFSKFAKCRPGHIRPMRQAQLRQCLCEYCTNVSLKLQTNNSLCAKIDNGCRIRHCYHAVDMVTCGRQHGAWQSKCVLGQCNNCSRDNFDRHVEPLQQHQGNVTWMKWESTPTVVKGKQTTRKMLVKKEGTVPDFLRELKVEVIFLGQHLFRAHWQQKQFTTMKSSSPFPWTSVGMVLDFAENFTCSYQDEVQAAHWHHEQVTVHPIVCYYSCRICKQTVTESLVFISSDRTHDYHAVHHFTKLSVEHLKSNRDIAVDSIIQWTDGCSAQYKSKGPFSDISCALGDFQCTFERNFYGSRHGKGPSDGESAVIKSHASNAVKGSAAVITNARDLFEYCVESSLNKQPATSSECQHFLRTFFFVSDTDICRNRNRMVKTVKGTRGFHSVKCVQQNIILTRQLACFCEHCQKGIGQCVNIDIVGPWTQQAMKPDRQNTLPNSPHQTEEHLAHEHQPDVPPPPQPDVTPPPPPQPDVPPPPQPDVPPPPQPDVPPPPPQPDVPPPPPQPDVPPPPPQPDVPPPPPQPDVPPPPPPQPDVPPPPQPDVPPPSQQQIPSFGQFVEASIPGRNRNLNFFAKVTALHNENSLDQMIKVKFLKLKQNTRDQYIWDTSEESWVYPNQIARILPTPPFAPGRGLAYVIRS